jgi:hypothetical protein
MNAMLAASGYPWTLVPLERLADAHRHPRDRVVVVEDDGPSRTEAAAIELRMRERQGETTANNHSLTVGYSRKRHPESSRFCEFVKTRNSFLTPIPFGILQTREFASGTGSPIARQ